MKKFNVVYLNTNNEKQLFKVIAKDKNHAVMILRKTKNSVVRVINVVEVTDKKTCVKSKFNLILACSIAIVLIVMIISISLTNTRKEPVSYDSYVVKEGDTLWKIATNSDGWSNMDTTYIIDDMKEKSNCSSYIFPGQVVYIPMYFEVE